LKAQIKGKLHKVEEKSGQAEQPNPALASQIQKPLSLQKLLGDRKAS
jgi:hypothetical protein